MEKIIKTVIANQSNSANFITKGREYKVFRDEAGFYEIQNDCGYISWVYKSRFESEHLSNAKRIASEAEALAERERIRDIVAGQVRYSCSPGGEIFNMVRGSGVSGFKVNKAGIEICSDNHDPVVSVATEKAVESIIDNAQFNVAINSGHSEYVKVLEQLREVLRVPEGENIVTHAKVVRALADALIGLQK